MIIWFDKNNSNDNMNKKLRGIKISQLKIN